MGNNGNKAFYHLQIKTEKVQSFIFKNPKLKYMLGANSLIGEFFSSELINIKKKVEPNCGFFSTVGSGSHLKGHFDNIYSNFANDIISSAGGHFEAVFGDKNNLEKFLKEVLDHIDDKLPGLKIGYRVRRLDDNMRIDLFDKEESLDIDIPDSGCLLRYDSPYFYLCPEDGTNPKNTKYRASEETHIIEEQGNEFYNLNTSDYLTKFYKNKNYLNKKRLFNKDKYELETIAKSSLLKNKNMIAVIKIDGNGMGNRFTKFKEKLKDKPLKEAFVEIEKFWWTNRETLRVALKNTINELKIESDDKNNDDTYLIMMLGGDDILIVTVPEIAIDLVKTFSKKLNESHTEAFNKIYNSKESNKNESITISAGVAFVKASYPFYLANNLAESLLDSAKVKSKTNAEPQNAIDWHILQSSYSEDINDIRVGEYLLQFKEDNLDKSLILTERPYLIDDDFEKFLKNCNNIVKEYKSEADSKTGKNKFKRFRYILKDGHKSIEHYGKLMFEKGKYDYIYHIKDNGDICINSAIDYTELADILNKKG